MWVKKFSKVYKNIKKEEVWKAWAEIKDWPKWDSELEYCDARYDFKFSFGNHFILKPIGGPKVKIMLSEVLPNEKFVVYCKFLGATMVDTHELKEESEGLRITNTISVKGPLAFLWLYLVAKNVAQGVPTQTDNLIHYVRS